ncbi:MAG: helix-turn-helix transcriptional regulator [Thermoguttaceae bacterium]|nr:helix-turn-helix transcriptional regulator [Thermoguttaceae bacterium]MBP3532632.1 helix-turn-helix transcriptional regulator [Thermoguttaceae bacterium]
MNKRLKLLRAHMDLKQDVFGEKLGVSKQAVSNWETGVQKIPESQILSISRTFNVSAEWLRTGKGEMFEQPQPKPTEKAAQSREEILAELITIACKLNKDNLFAVKTLAKQFEKELERGASESPNGD